MGMYRTFQRFAQEDAMHSVYYRANRFAASHPVGQDRVFDLNQKVEASPYRDVRDSPQVPHTFQMVQAKLAGFVLPVKDALIPLSGQRYQRGGALCPVFRLYAPAEFPEGTGRNQQPDPGRAEQSLFLRSARPDSAQHAP